MYVFFFWLLERVTNLYKNCIHIYQISIFTNDYIRELYDFFLLGPHWPSSFLVVVVIVVVVVVTNWQRKMSKFFLYFTVTRIFVFVSFLVYAFSVCLCIAYVCVLYRRLDNSAVFLFFLFLSVVIVVVEILIIDHHHHNKYIQVCCIYRPKARKLINMKTIYLSIYI